MSPSDSLLIVALGTGTVLSILLALLSVVAFVKRRTVSDLLITVAVSTFLGKTSLGLVYLTSGRACHRTRHVRSSRVRKVCPAEPQPCKMWIQ
ncbi:DUF7471 family protein [Haloarcula halobia]|uniref:DUF7471 family protein n=1 Tax=Haloarcula halobia TaxID=3033388 RepID=UPI003AF3207E